jgi:CubicO group peptidase (beta-lactamase class C family)
VQIDAEIARLMKARQVPGLAVALIENGQPVFLKTYGVASVEKKQSLQSDTILYAASLTKLAFTYMVMQLVDEHLIDLDRRSRSICQSRCLNMRSMPTSRAMSAGGN